MAKISKHRGKKRGPKHGSKHSKQHNSAIAEGMKKYWATVGKKRKTHSVKKEPIKRRRVSPKKAEAPIKRRVRYLERTKH